MYKNDEICNENMKKILKTYYNITENLLCDDYEINLNYLLISLKIMNF